MGKAGKEKKEEAATNKVGADNQKASGCERAPFAEDEHGQPYSHRTLCFLRGLGDNFTRDIHINFPNRMIFCIDRRGEVVVIPIRLLKRQLS
ncbi:hypothetical protein GC56T2_0173 [Geobacillus sp. C56-T2]|nr:hypothetical protein GC56T2_0173 [Geobacillus sp. C56-T2]